MASPRKQSLLIVPETEQIIKYSLHGNLKDLENDEAELNRILKEFITVPSYENSLLSIKEKTKDTKVEDLVNDFTKWIKIYGGIMEGRESVNKLESEWRSYKLSRIRKTEKTFKLVLKNKKKKKSKQQQLRKDLLKTAEYLTEKTTDLKVRGHLEDIRNWLKGCKEKQEVAYFHEMEVGSHWLATSDIIQRLAQDNDNILKDNRYTRHVISYIYGLQIRKLKMGMQPGTECIIEGLSNQLLQQPFRPLRLFAITKGDRKYFYQVSRHAIRSDVELLCSKGVNVPAISDICTYTSLVVTCLLSNLLACNPANIITELEFDDSEAIRLVRFKGIEGFNFKNPPRHGAKKPKGASKNGNLSTPLIIQQFPVMEDKERNILFLFPQMDDLIPDAFIQSFLSISPELMLINWLNLLEYENRSSIKLLKKKIFTSTELEGDPKNRLDKGFGLPIKIAPGLTKTVYETLTKFQNFLLKNPQKSTLHHLLELIAPPGLADIYFNARLTNGAQPSPILSIYKSILPRDINYLTSSGSDSNSSIKSGSHSPRANQNQIANALGELLVEIPFVGLDKNIEDQIFESLSYIPLRNLIEICWLMIPRNNLSFELLHFFKSIGMDINEINHEYGGYTLLHVAVIEDNIPLVEMLLKSGAEINARDARSETPLDKATKRKYAAMIEFLLRSGATASSLFPKK